MNKLTKNGIQVTHLSPKYSFIRDIQSVLLASVFFLKMLNLFYQIKSLETMMYFILFR